MYRLKRYEGEKFPVFSREAGNPGGDEFANDCLHRQKVIGSYSEPGLR